MSQMNSKLNGPLASRRNFLKSSAAMTAGGVLLANPLFTHAAVDRQEAELKVALIGCGGRGTAAAGQALSTKGKVKLWAVCDAFEDNMKDSLSKIRKNFSDRVDVPESRQFYGFDGYQKAIDSGVDVVVIATPPGFRPIHFEAAVKADKHIFMEKPVAVDAPGVRRVLEAAAESKKKNLCVGVGLQRHHQANYLEAIKRIHDGELGDILLTRVYWNGDGVWTRPRKPGQTEMEYQMRNWYYFNWLCGDHIVEQHIHNLDVSNWVKKAHPVSARGMGGRQVRTGPEAGEIFDHHAVEYTYADGTTMMSQCRHIPGCWPEVNEFAIGTEGSANLGGGTFTMRKGGTGWSFSGENPNPYQVEHDDFFLAIRTGDPDYNEAENGANATMTAILGRLATYSGKELSWKQAINSEIDLSPQEYSFDAEPPVLPDEDGYYPIVVPGQSKVV